MSGLDHALVYEARKFVTAENVHRLKTWIFCYETTAPNSSRHKRYEELLREFVATKRILLAVRMQAEGAREHGISLRRESSALEEGIRRRFKGGAG